MKLISILFIVFTGLCSAQNYSLINGEVVKSNNDTIQVQIRVVTNLFNDNLVDDSSFSKDIVVYKNNTIEFLKPKNIKSLSFKNQCNETRKFVSDGKVMRELIYDGRIKFHRKLNFEYMIGTAKPIYYIIGEDGIEHKVGAFNSVKNKLKLVTISKPELISEIEKNEMSCRGIISVLEKYDDI